jgi:hypothetical protein
MTNDDPELAKDLLLTAAEIAEFLKGSRELTRPIYHLAATSNVPIFKLGSQLCARKSVLLKWIKDQEERRTREPKSPPRSPRARQRQSGGK